MTDFTVHVASLTGFELDLSDLGTNFTTDAARLLPRVALPAGSAEATEYGGWTLPPNGKVLLARKEVIRDTEYKLAVEMSPSDLVWMLDKSGFIADFRKLFEPTLVTTIAGPDLASSPNVQKAQDTFTSPKGKVMFRRVAVDERTPETRIVHIEFQGI
ncbi:hypothetical protein [Nocardia amikacinitolerans]|uniref:hypothetical protein n=1 Tax=Nocardia amikacinitolerans TaxID=756689 RepID=UPI0020A438BB|nr:hypothetical protein [Nocardia amikacinitolerans]MCP2293043.1 hypothetical protein [Nocardia amikacinitolerans]